MDLDENSRVVLDDDVEEAELVRSGVVVRARRIAAVLAVVAELDDALDFQKPLPGHHLRKILGVRSQPFAPALPRGGAAAPDDGVGQQQPEPPHDLLQLDQLHVVAERTRCRPSRKPPS